MLATGMRSPLGLKIAGPDFQRIQELGIRVEELLREVGGTRSVFAERSNEGRYIDIVWDRTAKWRACSRRQAHHFRSVDAYHTVAARIERIIAHLVRASEMNARRIRQLANEKAKAAHRCVKAIRRIQRPGR